MYEPFWLEDFFAAFKEKSGQKCSLNQVMDVLDAECVTFRTRGRSARRIKQSKRSKRSPKKRKGSAGTHSPRKKASAPSPKKRRKAGKNQAI